MSIETTKDGKLALRIEVRTGDDGWTTAALEVPGSGWMVLLTVPAPAYKASTEVQAAVIALAQAVVRQVIADAMPGASIGSMHPIAHGAPLGGTKH